MSDPVDFTDEEGTRLRVTDEGGFFYVWTEHGEDNETPIVSIEAGELMDIALDLMIAARDAVSGEGAPP